MAKDVICIQVTIRFPSKVETVPAEIRYGKADNKGGYDKCLYIDSFRDRIHDSAEDKFEVINFDARTVTMAQAFVHKITKEESIDKVLHYQIDKGEQEKLDLW